MGSFILEDNIKNRKVSYLRDFQASTLVANPRQLSLFRIKEIVYVCGVFMS